VLWEVGIRVGRCIRLLHQYQVNSSTTSSKLQHEMGASVSNQYSPVWV
jgi:hypothetical protein